MGHQDDPKENGDSGRDQQPPAEAGVGEALTGPGPVEIRGSRKVLAVRTPGSGGGRHQMGGIGEGKN
jgi:hypothetical protein